MNEIVKKFRIFFAWQDNKEAEWLREMAQSGLHFEQYFFFIYTFRRGKPQDIVYQLDFFFDTKTDKNEYLQFFADDGWELVSEFSGWHYFRKPFRDGENTRIYTDKDSLIQKYRKILLFLIISGGPSVYFAFIWPSLSLAERGLLNRPGFTIIRILLSVVAVLVLFSILRMLILIRHLKRDR
jgi:hypothetical protein